MKKVASKPAAKKTKATTTKKTKVNASKKSVNKITFNKYSIYFQTAAILFLIAAFALHLCCYISTSVMLDLFGISVFLLAFSLFPERSH